MHGPTRPLSLAAIVLALAAAPAWAQAPDCTGISDVSSFDGATVSDMTGVLTTVPVPGSYSRPLLVTAPVGDIHRIFVVEQDGRIEIVKDGVALTTPFLDISGITRSPSDGGGDEEGLLGLAFHPDYDTNGWFFVYYTQNDGQAQIIARYTVSSNPDVADAGSRVPVISVTHNFASNHNGGMIAFSPVDGHLYAGVGDGGSGCDPTGAGQSLATNLGKILRLNVDALPYTTSGNPYDGGTAGNDEIWSYGWRNPWRFSFDRTNGALYVADVGQGTWEEINCQVPGSTGGENWGWDIYEGNACPAPGCSTGGSCATPYQKPKILYDHAEGCSVTGGYVYRGCRMGDLRGTYFYGDYCSAWIRTTRTDALCATGVPIDRTADLDTPSTAINLVTSFGEDARGEIYITDRGGEVFKVVPQLAIMEVSGENAAPILNDGANMTWEDLRLTSGHPIASYRVYRSEGSPTGPFDCVHQSTTPVWSGGDPQTPMTDEVFFYLVTARSSGGEETRPGYRSDGTPRTVNTASSCP